MEDLTCQLRGLMAYFKAGDILKNGDGEILIVLGHLQDHRYFVNIIENLDGPFDDEHVDIPLTLSPNVWVHLTELEKALL
jgi:hypothetical protein